jgi:hypothetical protein
MLHFYGWIISERRREQVKGNKEMDELQAKIERMFSATPDKSWQR